MLWVCRYGYSKTFAGMFMGWFTWKWFVGWAESHPWQFTIGIIACCSAIGGAVMFRFLFPKLWEEHRKRKEERRVEHYKKEILKTKALIESGKLSFSTTQEALASIPLVKKGDEELRNEGYRRIYPAKPHSSS